MKVRTDPDGAVIVAGDPERRFPRLLPADLTALSRLAAPSAAEHVFLTIFDLSRWAQGPEGADQTLLASLQREDKAADMARVRALGSVLDRVQIARAVMGVALTYGQEDAGG